MRIAYLVVKNLLRGGGIEKYTYELGRRMADRGHEITVFSMPHYGQMEGVVERMRVARTPCIRKATAEKLSAGATAAILATLGARPYDIVHFHSVAAGAFGLLPRLRGMKTVFQMHGIEWQRTRWSKTGLAVLRALETLSLRSHDAYTAVSLAQCEFYRRYGVNMHYIPTGAEIPEKPAPKEIVEMGLAPGMFVLFAARLVREKGAHHLIQAFRKMKGRVRLVIAGDAKGEEAYKAELRQAAAGDNRILFPGYVEGRKLAELFSHAALYVQPSEIEGLSISLLEAMGYGLCCLASDIPANEEALGDCGITFQNGKVSDLTTKLEDLLADPDIRAEIGRAARERIRQHYSWDRIADDFEMLYAGLLGRGKWA